MGRGDAPLIVEYEVEYDKSLDARLKRLRRIRQVDELHRLPKTLANDIGRACALESERRYHCEDDRGGGFEGHHRSYGTRFCWVKVVTVIFTSWNQIGAWLRQLNSLRARVARG